MAEQPKYRRVRSQKNEKNEFPVTKICLQNYIFPWFRSILLSLLRLPVCHGQWQ